MSSLLPPSKSTKLIGLIAVASVLVAVLATVGIVVALLDDDAQETALQDSLPVVPSSRPQAEFGAKLGEPVEEAAVVIPAPPPTTDATWDELTGKADAEGNVAVIVSLKTRTQPEGLLSSAARADQRQRIRSTERTVLRLVSGEASNVERFEAVPVMALEATPEALADLRNSPVVASVVEDVRIPIPPWPALSDDAIPAVASLSDWWDLDQAGVQRAWEAGYDGRGQAVAILDSGVQSDHPGLAGKVVAEACFSSGGNCPNGKTEQLGDGAAAPCAFAPINCAHGTHVAHTAAGKYGVAREAQILAVQVFSRADAAECQAAGLVNVQVCALSSISDQLSALEYIYNARESFRIAAVNLSLGGGQFFDYCDEQPALDRQAWGFAAWANTLRSVGIATVVSSGNNGYPTAIGSPACNSPVISVGATTIAGGSDAVAEFSNSARMLNLLAPGVHICSAVPGSLWECEGWQGTSMAAPHVTGALAVLRQLQPSVTVPTAQNVLSVSGAAVRDPRNGLVRARINVWDAVVALQNS